MSKRSRKTVATLFTVTSLVISLLWMLSFSAPGEVDFRWPSDSRDNAGRTGVIAVNTIVSCEGHVMLQRGDEWAGPIAVHPAIDYGTARFRAAISGTSDLSRAGFEAFSGATAMSDRGIILPYWFLQFISLAGYIISREPIKSRKQGNAVRTSMGY